MTELSIVGIQPRERKRGRHLGVTRYQVVKHELNRIGHRCHPTTRQIDELGVFVDLLTNLGTIGVLTLPSRLMTSKRPSGKAKAA